MIYPWHKSALRSKGAMHPFQVEFYPRHNSKHTFYISVNIYPGAFSTLSLIIITTSPITIKSAVFFLSLLAFASGRLPAIGLKCLPLEIHHWWSESTWGSGVAMASWIHNQHSTMRRFSFLKNCRDSKWSTDIDFGNLSELGNSPFPMLPISPSLPLISPCCQLVSCPLSWSTQGHMVDKHP